MSKVEWHAVDTTTYRLGLDQVVLYPEDGPGVPWNGAVSMDETVSNEREAVYFEGVKINDLITIGEFNGIFRAYTYPVAFEECQGLVEDIPGIYLADQPIRRFGLSWRTQIWDEDGSVIGHRINVGYNLSATPVDRSYQTLRLDEPEPMLFEWNVSGIPENVTGHRPTAHAVFDSTKIAPAMLQTVEDILYGTVSSDPELPELNLFLNQLV